jgi:plasmid stabilization system protein ParE
MPALVVRTRRAERDLAEIAEWTVRRFGVAQARRYGVAIEATLHGLRQAPDVLGARLRPELGADLWSVPVLAGRARSRHIVLFTWSSSERPVRVQVLRILRASMDPALHLQPEA